MQKVDPSRIVTDPAERITESPPNSQRSVTWHHPRIRVLSTPTHHVVNRRAAESLPPVKSILQQCISTGQTECWPLRTPIQPSPRAIVLRGLCSPNSKHAHSLHDDTAAEAFMATTSPVDDGLLVEQESGVSAVGHCTRMPCCAGTLGPIDDCASPVRRRAVLPESAVVSASSDGSSASAAPTRG
jgi:hypothetical protein